MQRRTKQFVILAGAIALAVIVFACATSGEALPVAHLVDTDMSVTRSDRTNCAQIGDSDLRSPSEGVWYQTRCLPASQFPQGVATTTYNRPSLGVAEFREVAAGLFVFRQTSAATSYLWFASAPDCLDLVSGRVVTGVCLNRAVSFQSDLRAACSSHGGILVRINGN